MDWFIEKETQNLIYWTDNGTPYLKLYLKDSEGQKASNWFDNVGVNEDASETLSNLNIKRIATKMNESKNVIYLINPSFFLFSFGTLYGRRSSIIPVQHA